MSIRTRREFLMRSCGGLGALALSSMLQAEQADPLAPKKPHHTPTAKSVIFLFMEGGPSHIDTFDPKPTLEKLAGQPMPASFGKVITAMGTASNTLMPSKRTWKQYGQSGTWGSSLFTRASERGALVASEPLDDDPAWTEVADRSLVCASASASDNAAGWTVLPL